MPPTFELVAIAIVMFLAIGLHEYAHCFFADLAGDPTPRLMGRLTLNLTKHFELTGTIMMILTALAGIGLGWGKPAPMDSRKMRNPRWDTFVAVAAGPISNLVQAAIYGLLFRVSLTTGVYQALPDTFSGNFFRVLPLLGVMINIRLCLFNLIPLGVLDGHWLVGLLLPERVQYAWFKFQRQAGMLILIGLIVLGGQYIGAVMDPPTNKLLFLLTGQKLP